MNKATNNKPGWRWARRILVGVGCLGTLIAAFYTEENWRGQRAWENCKRELKAKGAVLDWNANIPSPVPDDQNFFTVNTNFYLRFVKLQTAEQGNAALQLSWFHMDYWTNGVDLVKSKPLVARLTVVTPGEMVPAAAKYCLSVQFNSPNASRQIQEQIQTTVGRSANGSQGDKFSEFTLSTLAPAQIFLQAEALPSLGDLRLLIPPDLSANIGALEVEPTADPKAFEVRLIAGSITAAADFLKWSDKYVPAFDDVRAALKRPYAIIPGDYSQPFLQPIPNFVITRWLAQTLASRAQCYLLLGQPEKALPELTLMHDFCRILEKPPTGKPMTLVEAMINVAITGVYVNTIQDGFRLNAWQEPQMAAIQAQLAGLNLVPYVADAVRMEQVGAIELGEKVNFRKLMTGETFGNKTKGFLKIRSHVYDLMPRGWVYQNILYSAEFMQNQIDRFDPTNEVVFPRKWDQSDGEMNAVFDHFSFFHLWATMSTPNFKKAIQALAYNQTLANETQIVCALERYRLAHGNYPETLDALIPQFIEHLPHDLIGGEPLHYRRTDDGKFLLYSVGWNETDDGGQVVLTKDGSVDRTQGDWVWSYPKP